MPSVIVIGDAAEPCLRLLNELPPDVRVAIGESPEAWSPVAASAEVIFFANQKPALFPQAWTMAPRVQWVHSLWAGVDKLLTPQVLASPVPLTNAKGAFSKSLAEFCILGILFFAKDVRRLLAQQKAAHWEKFECVEIHGAKLGVIGYGDIGRAIAERGKGMGLEIHALRRNPALSAADPLIDKLYTPAQLHELLATCDYVALALPQTPDTVRVIGAAELARMKPSAVLLNVGRGTAVDEAALAEALRTGQIRAAALDVFEAEPLAPASPLWGMDNVLVSPHTADNTSTWLDDSVRIFLDNYRRFAAGEPLRNIVDKQAGY
jgi:phosphoglycerate dehydrogenase-like enzyme